MNEFKRKCFDNFTGESISWEKLMDLHKKYYMTKPAFDKVLCKYFISKEQHQKELRKCNDSLRLSLWNENQKLKKGNDNLFNNYIHLDKLYKKQKKELSDLKELFIHSVDCFDVNCEKCKKLKENK